MGSQKSESLNSIAKQLWCWCIPRCIWVSETYIQGCLNEETDTESRNINLDGEWMLHPRLLKEAFQLLEDTPYIDLFALRINKQLNKYISFKTDPDAFVVDVFSLNWSTYNFAAFPSFALISRTLQKIQEDNDGHSNCPILAKSGILPNCTGDADNDIQSSYIDCTHQTLPPAPHWPHRLNT